MVERRRTSGGSFWLTGRGLAAGVFIAAMLYFLLTEHRAHFFQALPYVIFLLCPLMHLFMHHGHGRNHSGGSDSTTRGRHHGN
jgi:hypothetical protein